MRSSWAHVTAESSFLLCLHLRMCVCQWIWRKHELGYICVRHMRYGTPYVSLCMKLGPPASSCRFPSPHQNFCIRICARLAHTSIDCVCSVSFSECTKVKSIPLQLWDVRGQQVTRFPSIYLEPSKSSCRRQKSPQHKGRLESAARSVKPKSRLEETSDWKRSPD
jgi:hypothetical protein